MTTRQIERLADISKDIGLAGFLGGLGDAVVNGTRQGLDFYSIVAGVACLMTSVWLGKLESENQRRGRAG